MITLFLSVIFNNIFPAFVVHTTSILIAPYKTLKTETTTTLSITVSAATVYQVRFTLRSTVFITTEE